MTEGSSRQTRRRLVALWCVACVLSIAGSAVAQPVARQSFRDQVADSIKQQTLRYDKQLRFAIFEIDRICDLSDEQKGKLEVASKGAIEEALFPRSPVFTGKSMTIDEAIDARVRADEKRIQDVMKRADELRADGIELPWTAFGLKSDVVVDDAAIQSKRWQKSIETILTEEQNGRYQAAHRDRLKTVRAAEVELVLARLDARLFFTQRQRVEMRKILAKVLEQQFASQALVPVEGAVILSRIRMIPYSLVEPILDDDQLKYWVDE